MKQNVMVLSRVVLQLILKVRYLHVVCVIFVKCGVKLGLEISHISLVATTANICCRTLSLPLCECNSFLVFGVALSLLGCSMFTIHKRTSHQVRRRPNADLSSFVGGIFIIHRGTTAWKSLWVSPLQSSPSSGSVSRTSLVAEGTLGILAMHVSNLERVNYFG